MTWALALKWALGHWRDLLIGAAVLVLVGAFHARDNALRAEGEQRVIAAQQLVALARMDTINTSLVAQLKAANARTAADSSTIARLTAKLVAEIEVGPHVDTLVQSIDRYLRDTVYVPGDTTPRIAVPAAAVVTADSALHACSEFVSACSEFKRVAYQRFANDSSRIATLLARAPAPASGSHFGFGVAAGWGAVYNGGKVRDGPGALAAVTWHP